SVGRPANQDATSSLGLNRRWRNSWIRFPSQSATARSRLAGTTRSAERNRHDRCRYARGPLPALSGWAASGLSQGRVGWSYRGWMDLEGWPDELLLARTPEVPLAFDVFYRRHVLAVQGYFRRRVFDVEAALDLTAETFAACLESVGRYEPRADLGRAWLF